MRKIVIFGANGNLGRQAAAAFKHAGWKVRAVTRDGKYDHVAGVENMAADAMNENQVINAAKGCDFIFNGLNPPYPQWSKMCMPMARNIMAAAKAHGAVHLFPGNVYNYGTTIPSLVNKQTPFNGNIKKGKIRIEMEELFEHEARARAVRTIIIRAGDFFGGNKSGLWFDLAITKKLGKNVMTYPGPIDQIHSWAYLPDLAKAFVELAQKSDELGDYEAFLFEGHAITGAKLMSALENVTGRRLKRAGMPWPLLRFISLFSPMLKEVCEMAYLWRTPHHMDGSDLAKRLGKMQHTSLKKSLAQALRDQGKQDVVLNITSGHVAPQLSRCIVIEARFCFRFWNSNLKSKIRHAFKFGILN